MKTIDKEAFKRNFLSKKGMFEKYFSRPNMGSKGSYRALYESYRTLEYYKFIFDLTPNCEEQIEIVTENYVYVGNGKSYTQYEFMDIINRNIKLIDEIYDEEINTLTLKDYIKESISEYKREVSKEILSSKWLKFFLNRNYLLDKLIDWPIEGDRISLTYQLISVGYDYININAYGDNGEIYSIEMKYINNKMYCKLLDTNDYFNGDKILNMIKD